MEQQEIVQLLLAAKQMYFGAVHDVAWLLLFVSCAISHVCCRSTGLTSVKHGDRQRGVMVTSFSFHNMDDHIPLHPPQWVTHYLQPASTAASLPLQCYFEILGFLDYPRRAPIGNINGTAQLSQSQLTSHVFCNYRNTFAQLKLEGESIPLAYYCPVFDARLCIEVVTFSKDVTHVDYDLTTQRKTNEYTTVITANTYRYDTIKHHDNDVLNMNNNNNNSSIISPLSKSDRDVAVCLVFPYVTQDSIQHGIIVEHIRWYHEVLGLKVIVYDRDGAHHQLLASNGFFDSNKELADDYHAYTIFDLQKQKIVKKILDTDQDKVGDLYIQMAVSVLIVIIVLPVACTLIALYCYLVCNYITTATHFAFATVAVLCCVLVIAVLCC